MYEDLKIFLSEDKLKPYLNMVNDDKEKAIKLYELNLEISSQFYKLIQILEVSSRNIFNKYDIGIIGFKLEMHRHFSFLRDLFSRM